METLCRCDNKLPVMQIQGNVYLRIVNWGNVAGVSMSHGRIQFWALSPPCTTIHTYKALTTRWRHHWPLRPGRWLVSGWLRVTSGREERQTIYLLFHVVQGGRGIVKAVRGGQDKYLSTCPCRRMTPPLQCFWCKNRTKQVSCRKIV